MGYIKKRIRVKFGFPRHKFFYLIPTVTISIRKDYPSMMGVKIFSTALIWGSQGFVLFSYFERKKEATMDDKCKSLGKGYNKGEVCNRNGCKGIIREREVINTCDCIVTPACGDCTDPIYYCSKCGYDIDK